MQRVWKIQGLITVITMICQTVAPHRLTEHAPHRAAVICEGESRPTTGVLQERKYTRSGIGSNIGMDEEVVKQLSRSCP